MWIWALTIIGQGRLKILRDKDLRSKTRLINAHSRAKSLSKGSTYTFSRWMVNNLTRSTFQKNSVCKVEQKSRILLPSRKSKMLDWSLNLNQLSMLKTLLTSPAAPIRIISALWLPDNSTRNLQKLRNKLINAKVHRKCKIVAGKIRKWKISRSSWTISSKLT